MDNLFIWQRQLCQFEVPQIQMLQKWVDNQGIGDRIQFFSKFGDPGLMFTLHFPLIAAMSWNSGARFLLTAILCEYVNLMLKWALRGERPYWFIHEIVDVYPTSFKQNSATCETGPGMPSGHIMANLVIWMILVDTTATKILMPNDVENPRIMAKFLKRMLWKFFFLVQVMVAMSRIYNLNHFPHQCLAGFMFGFLVIKLAYRSNQAWLSTNSRLKPVLLALALIVSSLGFHSFLQTFSDHDPDWSIQKAMKYCQNRNWIFVDTIPFYVIMRFSGAALGLAFCLRYAKRFRNFELSSGEQIIRLVLGLFVGMTSMFIHKNLPQDNLNLFYGLEYGLNAVTSFAILIFVPYIGQKCLGIEVIPEKKFKKKEKRR